MKKYLNAVVICAISLLATGSATAKESTKFSSESEDALFIIGYADQYPLSTDYIFHGINTNTQQFQKNRISVKASKTNLVIRKFGESDGIVFFAKTVPPGDYAFTEMRQSYGQKRAGACASYRTPSFSLRPGQVGLFAVPNLVSRGNFKGSMDGARVKAAFEAIENNYSSITVKAELLPVTYIKYQSNRKSSLHLNKRCVKKNKTFSFQNETSP